MTHVSLTCLSHGGTHGPLSLSLSLSPLHRIFYYRKNECSFDATVGIAVADSMASRDCWHPDCRINLRYHDVSHILRSCVYIDTYARVCV